MPDLAGRRRAAGDGARRRRRPRPGRDAEGRPRGGASSGRRRGWASSSRSSSESARRWSGSSSAGPNGTFIVPFDRKIDARLRVPDGKDLGAPDGLFVEARILAYPDDKRLALAEVIEKIGFEGDPGVDVEVVARKWGLPRIYSEKALREAEEASGEVGAGGAGPARRLHRADDRHDRRRDGARLRRRDRGGGAAGGGFRLGVHIADVSHYVGMGTALDADAFERGTSVYFPDRAIADAPRAALERPLLSPARTRSGGTVSAVLTLDAKGEVVKAEFFRSLIRSKARLTYTQVGDFLEGKKGGGAATRAASGSAETCSAAIFNLSRSGFPISSDVASMLRVAQRAARVLRAKRSARGSLDFDLPDADVILGETGDIVGHHEGGPERGPPADRGVHAGRKRGGREAPRLRPGAGRSTASTTGPTRAGSSTSAPSSGRSGTRSPRTRPRSLPPSSRRSSTRRRGSPRSGSSRTSSSGPSGRRSTARSAAATTRSRRPTTATSRRRSAATPTSSSTGRSSSGSRRGRRRRATSSRGGPAG